MKILNLFAGIGGNRALWGTEHEITAVEHDSRIAYIYHKHFPEDEVIVGDAYEYFRKHFWEFDMVWASPECQSHTRLVKVSVGKCYNGNPVNIKLPDMRMWGLILFLKHQIRAKWVVENVQTYYEPLVKPTAVIGRHWIWASNPIPDYIHDSKDQFGFAGECDIPGMLASKGMEYNLYGVNIKLARFCIDNAVRPDEGKWILDHLLDKGPQRRLF